MKYVIKKQQLLKNIHSVVNAISSRTVIPILTGMKIDVRNNHVVVTESNFNITIQTYRPQKKGEVEIITKMEECTNNVPLPQFPEINKKLPKEPVEMTVYNDLKATIHSGHAVLA